MVSPEQEMRALLTNLGGEKAWINAEGHSG